MRVQQVNPLKMLYLPGRVWSSGVLVPSFHEDSVCATATGAFAWQADL